MNKVTIPTSPTCSNCQALKNLLQQYDVDYQEVDLLKDSEKAQQFLQLSKQRNAPQAFINDQSIGGFGELSALSNDFDFAMLSIN